MTSNQKFTHYVSRNILGMLGISLYILADTFFISKVEGANGIAALNLIIPMYSLVYAIGMMIGVGSSIRFKIGRAKGEASSELYFSNAIEMAFIFSIIFMVIGIFFPEQLLIWLGGDDVIVKVGTGYTRIFLTFAPCFMWNHICNAFVRNDQAPTIAMLATLVSSLFNIVLDYILMFPLRMGMEGAALATAISPLIGISICGVHFISKKNTIRFVWKMPSFLLLFRGCQLGISALIGELASGITIFVFNSIILSLAGNTGVAAYAVVANYALVAISIFNGIAQGSQPLLSESYGKKNEIELNKYRRLGFLTSILLASCICVCAFIGAEKMVSVFNHDHDLTLTMYAVQGLRLYFIGFLFAGCNIVGCGYLSAVNSPRWAFLTSISRGVVSIIVCVVLLSNIWGMTGVWLAFPAAELLTFAMIVIAMRDRREKKI